MGLHPFSTISQTSEGLENLDRVSTSLLAHSRTDYDVYSIFDDFVKLVGGSLFLNIGMRQWDQITKIHYGANLSYGRAQFRTMTDDLVGSSFSMTMSSFSLPVCFRFANASSLMIMLSLTIESPRQLGLPRSSF